MEHGFLVGLPNGLTASFCEGFMIFMFDKQIVNSSQDSTKTLNKMVKL